MTKADKKELIKRAKADNKRRKEQNKLNGGKEIKVMDGKEASKRDGKLFLADFNPCKDRLVLPSIVQSIPAQIIDSMWNLIDLLRESGTPMNKVQCIESKIERVPEYAIITLSHKQEKPKYEKYLVILGSNPLCTLPEKVIVTDYKEASLMHLPEDEQFNEGYVVEDDNTLKEVTLHE